MIYVKLLSFSEGDRLHQGAWSWHAKNIRNQQQIRVHHQKDQY